jgi:uncharacterized protein (TIGR02246 family)
MKKKFAVLLSALILVSVLAGCGSTENNSPGDAQDIETLIKQTYRDALAGGDADTIVDAYTTDGIMMPQGFPTASGQAAVCGVYEAIFAGFVYDLQFTIDEIIVLDDYAVVRSTSVGTASVKATDETAPDANRELWIMQKVEGQWKIARYMFNKDGN